ncbi:MAG: polysaccharide deacetylase family protein [Solirubrobacteraceae bacterium]|nr:polysaccharide deacetylase family protein [Solirubrobacteraceae bacterium]
MTGGEPPIGSEERQRELQRRRAEARGARRGGGVPWLALVAVVATVIAAGALAGWLLGRDPSPSSTATSPPAAAPATTNVSVAQSDAGGGAPADGNTPATDPRTPADWPRSGTAAHRTRVPILMYHLIAEPPAGTAYPGLWVPPDELQAHVSALRKAGYVGVTLGEVWDAWHGDGRLPDRPVVLSFDDGSISQVMAAAPVLKDAGWPGVLNLTLDHVGNDGIPKWGVRRLIKQGWDIDSHTLDHPDVTTLGADELRRQLVDSRKQIKQQFGVTARFFCYPGGRNDATSRAAVKRAGYEGATTTEPGLAARSDDPFGLPRLRVDPGLSGPTVVKLASGA